MRGFVFVRTLANIALIVLAFAIVIPDCFVPAHGATAEYFEWYGLIVPFLIAAMATYCLWFWK
jgi:hypothetical protein